MDRLRARNLRVLALAGLLMATTGGVVVYAPTLYRIFCSLTGVGGTVRRAAAPAPAAEAAAGTVTVFFDANVDAKLPWSFRPEQQSVKARIGEPTKVYYDATNNADETLVGRAVYNVTPFKAAPYFFKIECFCFTEEKLGPGESARMPLVFYVDEEIAQDHNTTDVHQITLSYTFYEQEGLTPEEIEAARPLKAGSEATDAKLKAAETVDFENDAPRR